MKTRKQILSELKTLAEDSKETCPSISCTLHVLCAVILLGSEDALARIASDEAERQLIRIQARLN